MFAIPSVIIGRQVGLPRRPRPRRVFTEGLCALLALVVLLLTVNMMLLSLAHLFGPNIMPRSPLAKSSFSMNGVEYAVFLILAVLIAPVAEEFFFRGMLFNALRQRLHMVVAAPLQALVFGFLHPFDVVDSALVALVGLACALLYEWRKTLLAPIMLHSMVNIVWIVGIFVAAATAPRLGVAERGP